MKLSIKSQITAIATVFTILVMLYSCTEPYPIDPTTGNPKLLTVQGNVSNISEKQWIRLTRSTDYFDTADFKPENNAFVEVFELDTTKTPVDTTAKFIYEENEKTGYYYTQTEVAGIPNRKYVLNIRLQDGSSYTANSHLHDMKSTVDTIKVEYIDNPMPNDTVHYYKFLFSGQEEPGKGQGYWWRLFLDNKLYSDTLQKSHFENDEMVDGNYIKDLDIFYVKNENIKNDSVLATVEFRSIPNDQYFFFLHIMLETDWRGSMFDSPPANIVGNISNGAYGYFGAHYVKSIRKWVKRGVEKQ